MQKQIFVINVDQGNFICVKNCYKNTIVIIDAGSSNLSFEDLDQNSLEHIFKGCTVSAIILTHLDEDHYNYLKQPAFKDFLNPLFSDFATSSSVLTVLVIFAKNFFIFANSIS